MANKCALCVRYDALGEDVDGNMGLKNKAYMEGRAKLLESGGKVIKQGGKAGAASGLSKWQAKADTKDFNKADDFVKAEEPKKKRVKTE